MQTTETLIGTANGVPTVESGPITLAVPAPISRKTIRKHIRNYTPFECDDWDTLCLAIVDEYDEDWLSSIAWILGGIRSLKEFEKVRGSWNVPIKRIMWYSTKEERECYKVFRQNTDSQLAYEFHPTNVPLNQWIQAEISGSPYLTGMKSKENGGIGGRFHMLWNESQAHTYLGNRVDVTSWFTKEEAVIKKVKARKLQTIDLIYVPPKQFVWGIDADEMYVEL